MLTVKTLAGDFLLLQKENPEQNYIHTYVKEKFQPFTTVNIQDHDEEKVLFVNVHDLPSIIEQNMTGVLWSSLSLNSDAIPFLRKNINKVDWANLCAVQTPEAIQLLSENLHKNFHKIDWEVLSENPCALSLLVQRPSEVSWSMVAEWIPSIEQLTPYITVNNAYSSLLRNPNCQPHWVSDTTRLFTEADWVYVCRATGSLLELALQYPEFIQWKELSKNPSPLACTLMEQNPEKVVIMMLAQNSSRETLNKIVPIVLERVELQKFFYYLSSNPAAIDILLEYVDFLNWEKFSNNRSPEAEEFLKQNPHRIRWRLFCFWATDMEFMKKHLEQIDWESLSENTNAIELLRRYPEHIVWKAFCWNKKAMPILLNNLLKVEADWHRILRMPDIICPSQIDF